MDFFDISKQEKPERGDLLISNPIMEDPNFERSVIYLAEHSEEGSLGFVINLRSESQLNEIIEGLDIENIPVYVGGPVEQNTLHFIYSLTSNFPFNEILEGSIEIQKNVFMGGDFEQLKSLIALYGVQDLKIKFFIGYSGWSEKQLQKEIESNSWVVVKNQDIMELFENKDQLHWRDIMKKLGGRYKMMSNYPVDPRLN